MSVEAEWRLWAKLAPELWLVAADAAQGRPTDPACAWANRSEDVSGDGKPLPPNRRWLDLVPEPLVRALVLQHGRMTTSWLCDVFQMRQIPGLPPGSRQPYALGKYEVTQGLYETVTGTNPSHFKGDPLLPVERVSWEDATEFCELLNTMLGQALFRLPTEQEWEFAARAGQDFLFAGSDNPDEVAWTGNNSRGKTHPVGQKKANAWGLHDMSGNVWERTSTAEGPFRVARGGSWHYASEYSQVARRDYGSPSFRSASLGFRLAMDIPEISKSNPYRRRYA